MSEIKVNSIKGVGASAAAITVNNSDGTCTANITNKPNRNLIINGAMQVAQRGTSSTSSSYQTVDRFLHTGSGWDEAITQSQSDVASGTTPYTLGFRKAFKITNGNQTGGAGANDNLLIQHKLEGQDVAGSGWNYNSASSFITLSFWVKSSVAQNFYFALISQSGTQKNFPMETGSLSADTWTKITKTISGNSGITINNDNALGLLLEFMLFRGTDKTGSVNLNEWSTYSGSARTPDQTSTWYTTNDATFEITGVQLEVSDHASDFQFRSFAEELALCQRYFYQIDGTNNAISGIPAGFLNASEFFILVNFPVNMRATPSFTGSATAFRMVGAADSSSRNLNNLVIWGTGLPTTMALTCNQVSGGTTGYSGSFQFQADNGFLQFSAEL